jgi:hypothetical protein
MTFQFDTSGYVMKPGTQLGTQDFIIGWSDLSPFVQGYVEALAREWPRLDLPDRRMGAFRWGFRHLAPETLARIMDDCETWAAQWDKHRNANIPIADLRQSAKEGEGFWSLRQRNKLALFPPLTVYLGDDGKIYFKS